MSGFGDSAWGLGAWGLGDTPGLRVVSARPVRENVVRLFFNVAPLFTGLLDPIDASEPSHYDVVALDSTGSDGLPARNVNAAGATRAPVAGSEGRAIDLAVDRRFSPYPARYSVSVVGLRSIDGAPLDVGFTSASFDGLREGTPPPLEDLLVARDDISSPTAAGAGDVYALAVDGSGDYAIDRGSASLRKRIARRLSTRRGRFVHLPTYGVGLPDQVKRLARPALRSSLAAEAESQIRLEPDVAEARVTIEEEATAPGVFRFVVRVKSSAGPLLAFAVPIGG